MKELAPIVALGLLLVSLDPAFAGKAVDNLKATDRYPLKTCVVTDEKLGGDMGAPYVFIYKDPKVANDPGREVRLCCKGCLDDFKADPAKYLKKLDDALAAKSKK